MLDIKRLLNHLSALCFTLFLAPTWGVAQGPLSPLDIDVKQPPMGWNSWNRFGCDVSEQMIREMADAMVESGMQDAGYEYIVIDDCWQIGRDDQGNIVCDPERFPSGMKALGDYIHAKGLKFGIYSCAGAKTCANRPGSRGYQFQDAKKYAEWGVDFLKYDWCANKGQNAQAAYLTMRDALDATGRPMVLSICEWGYSEPWKWGKGIGQLWRVTNDIQDCWDCEFEWEGVGVINIIDQMADLRAYSQEGAYNDPDMLEVGNGGMNHEQYKSHFAMWCMLNAPLFAGNDLRSMDKKTQEILLNKELIALTKDDNNQQAFRAIHSQQYDLWVKSMTDHQYAFAFMNRTAEAVDIHYDWQKYIIADKAFGWHQVKIKPTAKIRDLWLHKTVGSCNEPMDYQLKPFETLVVLVSDEESF
ncbi:alpha-galactosidase [Persicobacter diffluens]|uniref:Alpha-galactosidase n=1 Tax=Persicobacter diffluens TaxID=981 RepID=A0AAN5APT2_9BACT|nr:hypothetical protein PEDI_47200 [Persicobacter diffluens]